MFYELEDQLLVLAWNANPICTDRWISPTVSCLQNTGKCNIDPFRAHFTEGITSFLRFLLQSILVLSWMSKKSNEEARRKEFSFKTLHFCCALQTVWMAGGAGSWRTSSESLSYVVSPPMAANIRIKENDYISGVWGQTLQVEILPKQLWCRCCHLVWGTADWSVTPTQILSLSLSVHLVWSEPALPCLVWSSPVVPYLETLWSADLTAYLFTELFDMHVCFYRFPSMLLCVGLTAAHVTEETERLPCWTAES